MTNGCDTPESINSAMLTPLVRQALESETVEIVDWDCQQIHGTGGDVADTGWSRVFRFIGRGYDGDRTIPWSLVLRALRPIPSRDDPSGYGYWKREVLAYHSGMLDALPDGLVAPRCFGITEQPGDEVWLWMEEVCDEVGKKWPLDHYGVVARHLGRFNGAYLIGRPIPSQPWLSEGWLRHYVEKTAPVIEQLPAMSEHPLVRHYLPGDDSQCLLRLWNTLETFLTALDHLPRTFCHMDAHPLNLLARRREDGCNETVAIDWASTGLGAIGEDIVPLTLFSLAIDHVDLAQARALDDVVYTGYLEGLYDTGWQGNPREVRLGFTAGAIRYALGTIPAHLAILRNEERYAFWERAFGRPLEDVMDAASQIRHFILNLLAEARELVDRA